MDAGAQKARAAVAAGCEFDRVSAFVDPCQLSVRKFFADDCKHSAGAATGIEQRKGRAGRGKRMDNMLPERLVPPIMVLDRTHNVVFVRLHPVQWPNEASRRPRLSADTISARPHPAPRTTASRLKETRFAERSRSNRTRPGPCS